MDTTTARTRHLKLNRFERLALQKQKTPHEFMEELWTQHESQGAIADVLGMTQPEVSRAMKKLGFKIKRSLEKATT